MEDEPEVTRDNIWVFHPDYYIVIPTNGVVRSSGKAVMGAGLARQANDRVVDLDERLGTKITQYGNHVYAFEDEKIITFPTKDHYKDDADLGLIQDELSRLVEFADKQSIDEEAIAVPQLGCGLGGLSWDVIQSLLKRQLDRRFLLVSPPDSF